MWLLVKRLVRSQMRGGLLTALFMALVILASSLCVMMWEHSRNAELVYDDFYRETNLADVVVTALPGFRYNESDMMAACDNVTLEYSGTDLAINRCDTHYTHREEFITPEGEIITLIAHGFVSGAQVSIPWFDEDSGEMPEGAGEVAVDRNMFRHLGIATGDQVTMVLGGQEVSFNVTGYANHANHLFYTVNDGELAMAMGNLAVVYMPVEELLSNLGMETDLRNSMLIDVQGTPDHDFLDTMANEGVELDQLRASLDEEFGARGIDKVQTADRSSIWSVEAMRQDLEGAKKTTPVFLVLLAGISALVMSISLERLVKRQSREIAVLRTIGVKSPALLMSYLTVPAFHGLVGGAVGVWLGRHLSAAMTEWYFDFIAAMPVVVENHYDDISLKVLGSVLYILLMFGLLPARKAVKLSPLEVMRQQAGAKPNPFVAWATSGMSPSVGLGFRSTFRNPGRLTMTVFGLGLSLILVSSMTMITEGMLQWVEETHEAETWDVRVGCDPINNQALRTWVEENSDSYEVEWAFEAPINASGESRIMILHLMEGFSVEPGATMHTSRLLDGRLPEPGASIPEVVVDSGVNTFLGWNVGDEVEVRLGITKLRFTVVGVVDEAQRSVWVHHGDLLDGTGVIGENAHNVLYLRNIGDANITGDDSLNQVEGVSSIIDKQAMVKVMDESWEASTKLFSVFILVGALIAIAVLLNTLMINITEHDTEFATLRTLGASSSRLVTIMLFEHLVIGIIGGVVGAVASLVAAEWMGAAFSNWAFTMSFPVQWDIVLFTAVGVVVASVAVVPLGLFRVRLMDLVEKTKEFSH
ncbi:MAG: hypothetical protein CXX71_04125 [Methanobacteriota archaeon]|nr:MAG: hypothetical protein CXX71_04125 [Euryarchaeota archaeon]